MQLDHDQLTRRLCAISTVSNSAINSQQPEEADIELNMTKQSIMPRKLLCVVHPIILFSQNKEYASHLTQT
jgi:hypothetical protein